MPLTLRIISKQKDLLGSDSTKVFSVHGGTIGRAPDNDWILPDPDRYVSAHHAIIDYQGGAYYLTDSSSNGVYVNDSDQSVGSGAPIRLAVSLITFGLVYIASVHFAGRLFGYHVAGLIREMLGAVRPRQTPRARRGGPPRPADVHSPPFGSGCGV